MERFDDICWTKDTQRLTQQIHRIQELGNLEHYNSTSTSPPTSIHYHSDYIEFLCLVKGSRNFFVFENKNPSSYHISNNEAFLVFPFELHNNGVLPQKPCEYLGFQLNVKDPDHILNLNPEQSYHLYQQLFALKTRKIFLSSTDVNLLRSSFQYLLFSERNPADISIGIQFLTCFLFNLIYQQPIETNSPSLVDSRIQRAINYIQENISEPLPVETLASISGLSVSRFKCKFKEVVGYPPAEYTTLQKIDVAKHTLETSDVCITDLAFNLGFSSSNYFSSVFRKVMGCTPREYRKQFLSQGKLSTANQ